MSTDVEYTFPYPTGLIRKMIQFPIQIYRFGWGQWVDWFPLLILTTRRQPSGAPHHVALEYRRHGSKYYLFSGWGERPGWVQNIKDNATVTIQHGNYVSNARASIVNDPDEAMRALYMFRRGSIIYEMILSRMSSADKIDFKTLNEVADEFTVIRIEPIAAPIEVPGLRPMTSWVGSSLIVSLIVLTIFGLVQRLKDDSRDLPWNCT